LEGGADRGLWTPEGAGWHRAKKASGKCKRINAEKKGEIKAHASQEMLYSPNLKANEKRKTATKERNVWVGSALMRTIARF